MGSPAPTLAAVVAVLLAPAAGAEAPAGAPARRDSAVPSAGEAAAAKGGDDGGALFQMVSGKVANVDRQKAEIVVVDDGKQIPFSYDRDTEVYLSNHLGTMSDVQPGAALRASISKERRAYWIEIRPAAFPAPSAREGGGPVEGSAASPAGSSSPTTGSGVGAPPSTAQTGPGEAKPGPAVPLPGP